MIVDISGNSYSEIWQQLKSSGIAWLIFLLTGVSFYYPSFTVAFVDSKEAFLSLAALLLLIKLLFCEKIYINLDYIYPIIVVLLFSFVHFIYQRVTGIFFSYNFHYALLLLAMIIMLNNFIKLQPESIVRVAVMYLLLLIVMGLFEYAGYSIFPEKRFPGCTFFGNTEFFSAIFSPLTVLILTNFLISKLAGRTFSILLLLSAFLFYFFLGSRIGFISMCCGCFIFCLTGMVFLNKTNAAILKKLLVAILLIAGIVYFLVPVNGVAGRTSIIDKFVSAGQNVSVRLSFWEIAWEMFLTKPLLGNTSEGFRFYYPLMLKRYFEKKPEKKVLFEVGVAGNAHCEPLQFLTEYGIAGFLSLLFFLMRLLLKFHKIISQTMNESSDGNNGNISTTINECNLKNNSEFEKIYAISSLTMICVFLINSLTSISFHLFPAVLLTLYFSYALYNGKNSEFLISRVKRLIIFLICSLISLQILSLSLSSHYFFTASYIKDLEIREQFLKKALFFASYEPRANDSIANLYIDTKRSDLASWHLNRGLGVSNNPGLYFTLGRLEYENGNYKNAARAFMFYAETQPTSDLADDYLREISRRISSGEKYY
ncbi:MAG: O-antigen ligase family protein [Candidatus Riflebacteria bacterium]|nr:O-antigen ligase family protein [Candidatus Riflebacteria bacterium]